MHGWLTQLKASRIDLNTLAEAEDDQDALLLAVFQGTSHGTMLVKERVRPESLRKTNRLGSAWGVWHTYTPCLCVIETI